MIAKASAVKMLKFPGMRSALVYCKEGMCTAAATLLFCVDASVYMCVGSECSLIKANDSALFCTGCCGAHFFVRLISTSTG